MTRPPSDDPNDRPPETGRGPDTPRPTRRRVLGGLAALGSLAGCGAPTTGTASPTPTTGGDAGLGPAPEPVGPWPQARADAGNTGVVDAAGPTGDPSLRWRVTAAGTVGALVGRHAGDATEPGAVYVASEAGRVARFTPSGGERWTAETPPTRFPPAVGSGRVVVPARDSPVVLDADTGDRIRPIDAPEDPLYSPTLAGDRALFGTFAGGVVAVDLDSGARVWEAGVPSRTYPPVVADGVAYATARRWETDDGERAGVVLAIDLGSGAIRWAVPLDGDPTAPPAVRDGTVYAGTNRGRVHAVGAADGDRRWRESVGDWVTRGPTAAADGIYVVVLDGGVAKLAHDGTVEWRSNADGGTNPVLAGDLAVVGTGTGVTAVDRADGRTRWQVDADAGVQFDPRAADGRIYAGDGYGTVLAIDADAGDPAWSRPMRPARMPGPMVGARTVAGGSRDGGTYDLLATDGTEFPLSGGAATTGVTPAVLDGRDLPEAGGAPTRTADGDLLFGDATRTAGPPDGGRAGGETLLGGGVDGSVFRVRTVAYGPDPSDDLGPTPTPTPTPGPGDPTASPTPVVDYPEAAPAWTTTLDAGLRSPVTSAGGVAYVGTEAGVVAVDPRDGSPRWRRTLGGPVPGAPAVADGRAFAVTAGGRLVGLDAETGAVEWELELDAGSGAGLAVAGGTVYVATDDGVVRTVGVDPTAYAADNDGTLSATGAFGSVFGSAGGRTRRPRWGSARCSSPTGPAASPPSSGSSPRLRTAGPGVVDLAIRAGGPTGNDCAWSPREVDHGYGVCYHNSLIRWIHTGV